MFPKAMKNSLGEKVWVRGIISSQLGVPGNKVLFTEHHQSHAAAAFLTAPTRRATILTADGVGEWATMTAGIGERAPGGTTSPALLREIRFPHSLGMLYSTFTASLGFKVNEDQYTFMGLAGHAQPAPGDAGCAIGAALYADRLHFRNADRDVPDHPFWGPPVSGADLARIAAEDGQQVGECDEEAIVGATADDLMSGRIVGWMEGALEFGPRALGHRSILAAPQDTAMRDRINREIKYREQFRPFAPIVPIELAERYFELPRGGARLARFMSGVFPVRPP